MFEQAIDARVLLLIKIFSKMREIADNFYLAGGTALAIHLGHRKSDDIDLFSQKHFPVEHYSHLFLTLNGKILVEEEGTIHTLIEGVKVSLLYYPYKLLLPFKTFAGLNMASVEDISCMKIVALSQRAEKKDFFDAYEILKIYKPVELKRMFLEKYGIEKINCYHILKSFFYFDDAENSPEPVTHHGITWDEVKAFFRNNEKMFTRDLLC